MTNLAPTTAQQPLGIMSLFSSAMSMLRVKPLSLIVASIAINLALMVITNVGARVLFGVDPTDPISAARAVTSVSYQIWSIGISLLGFGFLFAVLTSIAYKAYSNEPVSLGEAISVGVRKMIYVGLLLLIVYIAAFLPAGLIGGIIGAILGMFGSASIGAALTVIIVIPLGGAIALYILAVFGVVNPTVVIENIGFASLGRSARLTSGYRWSIVGFFLLTFLIMLLFSVILLGIGAVVLGTGMELQALATVGQSWSFQIFNAVLGGILLAYFICLGVALYVRLREIKEGIGGGEVSAIFE